MAWGRYMRHHSLLFFKNDGAVAIEFGFVLIPFIISILFIMELCRVVYVMSSVDLIISEAGSASVTLTNTSKADEYFDNLINKMASNWPFLLHNKNVKVKTSIQYCNSIAQLANNQCASSFSTDALLGVYQITVPYEPVFFPFPDSLIQNEMVRKVVFVQEHNLSR